MKITLFTLIIFFLFGLVSLVASILNNASTAILIFNLGYLVLAIAFGYILWKKSQST